MICKTRNIQNNFKWPRAFLVGRHYWSVCHDWVFPKLYRTSAVHNKHSHSIIFTHSIKKANFNTANKLGKCCKTFCDKVLNINYTSMTPPNRPDLLDSKKTYTDILNMTVCQVTFTCDLNGYKVSGSMSAQVPARFLCNRWTQWGIPA